MLHAQRFGLGFGGSPLLGQLFRSIAQIVQRNWLFATLASGQALILLVLVVTFLLSLKSCGPELTYFTSRFVPIEQFGGSFVLFAGW